jgi:hypothetical protein
MQIAEQPLAENSGPARIVEFPGAKSEYEQRRDQDGDQIKEQRRQVIKIFEEGQTGDSVESPQTDCQ